MVEFRVRVPDDIAQRFDAAAAQAGGRSPMLHRLINTAAGEVRPPPPKPNDEPLTMVRVNLYLSGRELAGVDAQAFSMGLRRASWVAALVRRRVSGKPTFNRPDELALINILVELRRIGLETSHATRALTTTMIDAKVLDRRLTYLEEMRAEFRGHMSALHQAFQGNLAYWEARA